MKPGSIIAALLYRLIVTKRGSDKEANLRILLQRFPYWISGHIYLGELQLLKKEKQSAYISALAALELSSQRDCKARHLLGKVYLQSGRETEARDLLVQLHDELPQDAAVKEDLAAAHLHFEEYSKAKQLLEQIPAARRTPQAGAMLTYLKGK